MPFVSQAQRAWMYANKPGMAAEWQRATPKGAKLPKRVKAKGAARGGKVRRKKTY